MTEAPPAQRARIDAVDLVRGAIMVVMALDHVRDFLSVPGQPTNLATTTASLFFTRWITHFCAPVFCLLTGVGARLSLGRKTRRELSRYLWTRGLWLIFLDLVVVRCLAYQFNFDFQLTVISVLWMLGWSMIVLSALIHLPSGVVATLGALLVAGHHLVDGVKAETFGALAPLWKFLHVQGELVGAPHRVFSAYPLIPWVGVMALGWSLGAIYAWPAERRHAWLLRLGGALTIAFVVVRAVNLYGDPRPWAIQATPVLTVLSFLNVTKQPPSLLFLLMTLGPALLLLRAAEARTPWWLAPVQIIGKAPLFYYVVHFTLIHAVAVIVSAVRFGDIHNMFESPTMARYPITFPPGWGFALPGTYAAWICVVVAMYPLCRWYAAVKQRRRDWWLGYL